MGKQLRGGKKRKRNRENGNNDQHEHDEDMLLDENGLIPNGFTIDFDDFGDHAAEGSTSTLTSRRKDGRRAGKYAARGEDDEDSTHQAPRGGPGSQVLPFEANLPEDHSGDPLDGHEYLFLVRREAATHPSIKTAEAFVRKIEVAMEVDESLVNLSASAGPSHRPSTEWRTSFLSRFTNMRQILATSSTQPTLTALPPHYLPIPAAQDESSWRTYINGRKGKGKATATNGKAEDDNAMVPPVPEAPTSGSHLDTTPALEGENGDQSGEMNGLERDAAANEPEKQTAAAAWVGPRPPIPVLMRNLDHYTTISLLEHFEGWLSERLETIIDSATPSTLFLPNSMQRRKKKTVTSASASQATSMAAAPSVPATLTTVQKDPIVPATPLILTPLESQWIFSLLTVLDTLLISGEISILRTLARTCRNIADFTWKEQQKWLVKGASENDLEKYTDSVAGCWMIIAAIWEVWGQRDLWDT